MYNNKKDARARACVCMCLCVCVCVCVCVCLFVCAFDTLDYKIFSNNKHARINSRYT